MANLTHARLRELLDYDQHSGVFTRCRALCNRVKAGDRAGGPAGKGYLRLSVDNQRYLAHRLAWLYVHGNWPDGDLDHINGDPSDNRIANLRPATRSQNTANGPRRRNNKSGFKGVSRTRYGRWVSVCKHQYLGSFATPHEAHAAYCRAATEMFGDYARTQ